MNRLRILLPIFFFASALSIYPIVSRAEEVDFNRDVRPILSNNCFPCHGPDEAQLQADLRLDQRAEAIAERDEGAAIVPGSPDTSLVITRVFSDDPDEQMPPADSTLTLSEQQKQTLRDWIAAGANWEEHWAFVAPSRPELPTVATASWPRNAIDTFVLARLEKAGITASSAATRQRLIRRVTLDLTGLPPTLDDVDAFLADESETAYETVVDRLLASPRYGERMVWDWLDAARYADTNGYQGDPERTMWPWRDWVVRALNANMSFEQFTIEQLAGDLLPGATLDQRVATGFNRNHMHNGEGGRIVEESRVENVMDRAETTATVWLGLTVTCCRCHDHKYDPLTMRDYYSLYAFFNNTNEDGAGRSGQMRPVVTYTPEAHAGRMAEVAERIAAAASVVSQSEEEGSLSAPQKTDEETPAATALREAVAAALGTPADKRDRPQLEKLRAHFQQAQPAYAKHLQQLLELFKQRDRVASSLPKVMVMDTRSEPRETFILQRGAYNKPGEKVTADVPAALPPLPTESPSNRLGLARWLVSPDNPLTARVVVNRYWQLFFGAGLVTTPEDFGTQGKQPTHPQLLDWLATEFQQSGWNVKQLHKLIVMSATYRQSSKVSPQLVQLDPGNQLLARGPRYRLPSWMLRDQALAISGLLVGTIGGPSVKPYQPENVWAEATFGKKKYVQDHGEDLYRRSMYTFWRRIIGPTMFFDSGRRQTCTVNSSRTNTPLHALTTLNDVTYVEAARKFAERIMESGNPSPGSRLNYAFRLATARRPQPDELQILVDRYHIAYRQFNADRQAAQQLLSVGESPRNDQLDVVEHAAYTALCSLILNLDETLTKE